MDPHHFGKLDPDPDLFQSRKLHPDPHLSEKQDPDPHLSEKQDPDPDPHQTEKVGALDGHFAALEGPNMGKVSTKIQIPSN